jgi:hypothetical protein
VYVTRGLRPGWEPTEPAIGRACLSTTPQKLSCSVTSARPSSRKTERSFIYQLLVAADQPTELFQLPASVPVRLVSRTYRTRPDLSSTYERTVFNLLCFIQDTFFISDSRTTEESGFGSRQQQGIFLLSKGSKPALGPKQLSIEFVPECSFPVVKRLGREADHSPQLVSTSRMVELYFHTLYVSMAWCLNN